MKRRILVVDIGGSFVNLLLSERVEREFASGPRMTPKQFVSKFEETVRGWKFDVASIGFPAAGAQWTDPPEPQAPWQKLGPFQFCAGTRITGASRERCSHARAWQLPRQRADAVSRTRLQGWAQRWSGKGT